MSYASKIHTNEGQTGLSNVTNKDVDNPTTVRLHYPELNQFQYILIFPWLFPR